MLITFKSGFFNKITYLLLNSDYGIGCVYSPLGLEIFVAVEGTFVCFTDWSRSRFSNSIGLYCYCAITELVMIRTSTSRTATRANRNSDVQNGNSRIGECRHDSHNVKNGTSL